MMMKRKVRNIYICIEGEEEEEEMDAIDFEHFKRIFERLVVKRIIYLVLSISLMLMEILYNRLSCVLRPFN